MIIESIAKAIKESGETRYHIAKENEIDEAILHRIVNGGSCSIKTADKLCKHLGLELKPKRKKR